MSVRLRFLIVSLLCLFVFAAKNNNKSFKVYFVPLDTLGYSIDTPEILKHDGMMIDLDSNEIAALFNEINNVKIVGPKKSNDDVKVYIIRNRDNKEICITNKKILLYNNNRYRVNESKINNAMKDIVTSAKKQYKEWAGIPLNQIKKWY